jgi:predicted ABC-type ATPase
MGPNGAGKTTAAMKLLPDFLKIHEFVNADEIARGLNPLAPQNQNIEAGRIMLHRIDTLITARRNFAFESTGSSVALAKKIQTAKQLGYTVVLIYLWLPSEFFAIQRVNLRVKQGGHTIAVGDIKRRHQRSLINLVKIYLPLADIAKIIDGSFNQQKLSRVIADKNRFNSEASQWIVYQPETWQSICALSDKTNKEQPYSCKK